MTHAPGLAIALFDPHLQRTTIAISKINELDLSLFFCLGRFYSYGGAPFRGLEIRSEMAINILRLASWRAITMGVAALKLDDSVTTSIKLLTNIYSSS
jgi:phosphoenolpyruvate carboxylase